MLSKVLGWKTTISSSGTLSWAGSWNHRMILRKSQKFNSKKLPYKTLRFMWQTMDGWTDSLAGWCKSRQKNAKLVLRRQRGWFGGLADGCMDTVRPREGLKKSEQYKLGERLSSWPPFLFDCSSVGYEPPLWEDCIFLPFYKLSNGNAQQLVILPPCHANPHSTAIPTTVRKTGLNQSRSTKYPRTDVNLEVFLVVADILASSHWTMQRFFCRIPDNWHVKK